MSEKKEDSKPYTFRFKTTLIEEVRKEGAKDMRDLTNTIEYALAIFVKNRKKKKK